MQERKHETMKDVKVDECNPLNLKGGDTVVDRDTGVYYLVSHLGGELRLHALDDGNIWSDNALMGYNYDGCMDKVELYFERVD